MNKIDLPEKLRERYLRTKTHAAKDGLDGFALEIMAEDRVGLIADITSVTKAHKSNINYIQSWLEHDGESHLLLQVDDGINQDNIMEEIRQLESVKKVLYRPTYSNTYGKRIIVMGGGAQVAQVASGAIAEADRHNIRGEKISIDTMPTIGEKELSEAIRGVGRLHRASLLVLAGALMGGEITKAVTELRRDYGIPVISLNMAGSLPKACDLIITDPLQAGVMSVMLVSHIGKFNLLNVHGKTF